MFVIPVAQLVSSNPLKRLETVGVPEKCQTPINKGEEEGFAQRLQPEY